MPYNNTPIAPSKEVRGEVSLPLSRVQKIINADPERTHVSKNASFAIALATEMFIQHLATSTHNVVKAERKPRRNIQYRDVATAVAKTDNLEFLVDVVPRTMTYGEFKKSRVGVENGKGKGKAGVETVEASGSKNADIKVMFSNGNGVAGKTVEVEEEVNGHTQEDEEKEDDPTKEHISEVMEVDDDEATEDEGPDPAAMQIEMEMRGPRAANGSSPVQPRRTSGFTAINGSK
ncbi:hypothetical protein B0J11DRAFT_539443 [Dendryphion nanum]|uniref:Transcription factor CBF/NF-Y/archaeal histone domain-containing protein n=1 Tax=Dendryphion nanum TaxID=256645 RepID=A0A9P9IDT3_9PLEO|nr:hypothetical protein B0J11DRAFT_539443 [Dendryphion nanum]